MVISCYYQGDSPKLAASGTLAEKSPYQKGAGAMPDSDKTGGEASESRVAKQMRRETRSRGIRGTRLRPR
jgi:hypothetical protein